MSDQPQLFIARSPYREWSFAEKYIVVTLADEVIFKDGSYAWRSAMDRDYWYATPMIVRNEARDFIDKANAKPAPWRATP